MNFNKMKTTFSKTTRTVFALSSSVLLMNCARPQYLSNETTGQKTADASTCLATFVKTQACLDFKWEKFPTETEMGSFVFTTSDQILLDLPSQTPIKVVLWMPSMGHGSSPVTVEKISTGLYRAKNVFFTMKGDWEIRFQTSDEQATYAFIL